MEFLAATKEGVIIYDATTLEKSAEEGSWTEGKCADGFRVKVVASLPSPANAFGHSWSTDGTLLASVCDEGVRIYDATNGYKQTFECEKVAPDVGGRAGGVRNVRISPKNTFMVAYEKWDPQYPENVHIWALTGPQKGKRLYSCTLKGYTSGALPVEIISWTFDESVCLELAPGKGIIVRPGNLCEEGEDEVGDEVATTGLIPEKLAGRYEISPAVQKDHCYVAVYTPETTGPVGRVAVYHLSDPKKATVEINLPAKVKDLAMLWNFEGSALLVSASSDVDETGSSYFGSSYLYWLRSDGKTKTQISGAKDGQVQDLAWSPTANEFMVIIGMLPATVALYDGKTGKLTSTLGTTRRNTIKWNPFGRLVAVGGFGTLAGDLDFFDRSKEETVCSLRAELTVNCAWSNDGKHFLACTVAPRMNEANQLTIYRYTGERKLKIDFKPDHVEGRHEDTGGGARTKTQALLFAASWRPMSGFEDTPATPRKPGEKRVKGLPEQTSAPTSSATAYRPRGEAGGSVAAMMRGEIGLPSASVAPPLTLEGKNQWDVVIPAGPTDAEIRKAEKQRKKDMELKEEQEKEEVRAALKNIEKEEKGAKKRLKELKQQLAELDALKEKDWDELTDEDEAQLEGEVAIREEIAKLEKQVDGKD